MRKSILLTLIAFACLQFAGAKTGKPAILVQKNFDLCFRMEQDAKVSTMLASDPVLAEFARTGRAAFEKAVTEEDAVREVMLSEQEIARVGERLSELAADPRMKAFCEELRKGGKYYVYNALPDGELLKAAWKQDAGGINQILNVYALNGKPPYYIDAPDPNLETVPFYKDAMAKVVRPAIRENALELSQDGLFFSLPMEVVLGYMDVNNRYEATDFEPMAEGVNAKCYAAARRMKWKKYPYSAILVLGSGPQVVGEKISPKGRVRCVYVAELYKKGLAPFIILSGGRAYPPMTTVTEAVEMKNYLMENCGIPEEALIVDPHARHTTTNLRNAARIMIAAGFPLDKPALITSTGDQLDYVQTKGFEDRCRKVMLMVPYRLGERIHNRMLEFWALPCATQINPKDPLDP